jgi:hypothetical protein
MDRDSASQTPHAERHAAWIRGRQRLRPPRAVPDLDRTSLTILGPSSSLLTVRGRRSWAGRCFASKDCALTSLDLSDIGLGDRGGVKLLSSLLHGGKTTLHELRLGNNGLRDETGRAMVEVLRSDGCCIRSLDLSHNAISGMALARAVKFAHSLTQLDVCGMPCDDESYRPHRFERVAVALRSPHRSERVAVALRSPHRPERVAVAPRKDRRCLRPAVACRCPDAPVLLRLPSSALTRPTLVASLLPSAFFPGVEEPTPMLPPLLVHPRCPPC